RWLHESFGSNYRGTEMQAAIGRIQYRKLPVWHKQRTENAMYLAGLLEAIPGVQVPRPAADETHAYYRLYGRLNLSLLPVGWDRDRVIGEMGKRGYPLSIGSTAEVYRELALQQSEFVPEPPLPGSQRRGEDALAFVVHPGVSRTWLSGSAAALADVMSNAGTRKAL
ncbi:MAG: DegT/DnrJ/EryC1/StrS aminotransferase family protein, partial [Myxococcales bacterium]|nr:DegT/DnrJ/EryC1/StrS aminotransferase family protein [Myxococcales bacterium]